MLDAPEKESAAFVAAKDGARGEDCTALATSYATEPAPGHLECEFLGQGFPSREGIAALRGAGVSDATLMAHTITEAPVRFLPRRRWEYYPGGIPSLLLAVRDAFGDVVDIIAWPITRPDKWARLTGKAVLLGEDALTRAVFDEPVKVWRTPLSWLVAGGDGLVVLDQDKAWRRLNGGPALVGEDLAHAKELRTIITPPEPPKVFVRNSIDRSAA